MERDQEVCSSKSFSSLEPQGTNLSNDEIMKKKLILDCGEDQVCVIGGIVALGKFDALHIGHRQLAIEASKAGTPFLLSFVGMAEVLGWETRPPIVAKCDRARVLESWAPYCGNIIPLEYQLEFSKVRSLTPRQFVERLAKELGVRGVVAGENYRFGYRASGDAMELVTLCEEFGLTSCIVSSVMDKATRSYNGGTARHINSTDKGQVSSSRVRFALSMGDMEYVNELLGRKHRLMLAADDNCLSTDRIIRFLKHCMLNQPPVDGSYEHCSVVANDGTILGPCTCIISPETVEIELTGEGNLNGVIREGQNLGVEFG